MFHHNSRAAAETPPFPTTYRVNNRLYVKRSDGDAYKAALLAYALNVPPVATPPVETDSLIPLAKFAAEIGVGRRTVGRRIRAAQQAAEQASA